MSDLYSVSVQTVCIHFIIIKGQTRTSSVMDTEAA